MERFFDLFERAKREDKKTRDTKSLIAAFETIAASYRSFFGVGDLLLAYGEELIEGGRYDAGISVFKIVENHFETVANDALFYVRLAEYAFENGESEKGKDYLLRFVSRVDNYEEAVENSGLSAVWDKYKSLLGDLKPSVQIMKKAPLPPEKCTLCIADILKLPKDSMLSALSLHLCERSADGECMESLTEEEKTFFYIDAFVEQLNADGISHYLSYYGYDFYKLSLAASALGEKNLNCLLSKIENKFPRHRVPKRTEVIDAHLEKMEENGLDFEEDETFYYETVEAGLIEALFLYVMEHSDRFH